MLLESLAEVKSPLLLVELLKDGDGDDSLLVALFDTLLQASVYVNCTRVVACRVCVCVSVWW